MVGHGPLGNKASIATYNEMVKTARDRVEKLVKEGKSEAEVVAAKPLADLDKTWAANDQGRRKLREAGLPATPPADRRAHHGGGSANSGRQRGDAGALSCQVPPRAERTFGHSTVPMPSMRILAVGARK